MGTQVNDRIIYEKPSPFFSFQPPVLSPTSPTGSCPTVPPGPACPTARPSTSTACLSSRRLQTRRRSAKTERGQEYQNVYQVNQRIWQIIKQSESRLPTKVRLVPSRREKKWRLAPYSINKKAWPFFQNEGLVAKKCVPVVWNAGLKCMFIYLVPYDKQAIGRQSVFKKEHSRKICRHRHVNAAATSFSTLLILARIPRS